MHGGSAAEPYERGGAARADAVARRAGRDEFLDLLRIVAILRVVLVHLAGAAGLLWWPAPTWVMPGMPVVFFVSGALALSSLDPDRPRPTAPWAFRRDRLRRLLVPYWAFCVVLVAAVVAADLVQDGDRTALRFDRLADVGLPFFVPRLSPASGFAVGHLWFMGSFVLLILLAPVLVRCHRARPGRLLAGTAALFVAVQVLDAGADRLVPRELDRTSLFALFFVAGFAYTDGRIDRLFRRLHPLVLASAFAVAAVGAYLVAPHVPNASEPLHGLLGAAWLCLALAFRPTLTAVARRGRPVLSRLTRRTLTIYLWGWPTTQLAERIVRPGGPGGGSVAAFVVLALALLGVAVAVFGPLEDVAARRVRPGVTPRPRRMALD